MKPGSIIGIILSAFLILAGIITCSVGVVMSKSEDRALFTQKTKDGTYYNASVPDTTAKIQLSVRDAEITVRGGAEKSQIEFINFNPNFYSVSSTPSVTSFEEIPDLRSAVKIWENGVVFKGLRYALDIRNFEYGQLDKSIIVSLSDDSALKIVDVTAENGKIKVEDLSFSGDILLKTEIGNIDISGVSTDSTISISGDTINSTVSASEAKTLKFDGRESNLTVKNSRFTDSQINTVSGRIDYYTEEDLSHALINISSSTGGMLINSKPTTGVFSSEPEEFDKTLKIKTDSAGVNLEYPHEEKTDTE